MSTVCPERTEGLHQGIVCTQHNLLTGHMLGIRECPSPDSVC
jgi:hypothetical protein